MAIDFDTTAHTDKVDSHGLTATGCQPFIDTKGLRKLLGVSTGTLEAWRRAGKLPFVRVTGRRILFHWPSVEAALLRQQRGQ